MAVISIGDNSARQISLEPVKDSFQGTTWIQTFEGDEASMRALIDFLDVGANGHAYPYEGPVWRARVQWSVDPISGTTDVPDVWETDIEAAEVDVFSSAEVEEAAGGIDAVATWRDDIQAKLKAGAGGGPVKPSETGFTDAKLELYTLVLRGYTSVTEDRPILKRRLNYPINYINRTPYSSRPTVWSTASLSSAWGVPGYVLAKLPIPDIAPPTYTQWGWKKRTQTATIIPYNGTVEEVVDFVFAAWPTLTHNHV